MRKTSIKGKLILMTVMVLLFGLYLLVKFVFFGSSADLGEITIMSTPKATVFIDQVQVGSTPHRQTLKVGEYTVKLIPDKDATQSATWQGKIVVYKNAVTYLGRALGATDIATAGEISTVTKMETKPSREGVGEIFINTDPAGALTYLDLDEKGVAPLLLSDVPKGTHEIMVYLPGFLRRTFKLNVESGYRTSTIVKLAIDGLTIKSATTSAKIKKEESSSTPTTTKATKVRIKDTPTGWLRVRSEPSVQASESAKVNPGETYDLLEEQPNWYKILFNDEQEGWVASEFADKISQ